MSTTPASGDRVDVASTTSPVPSSAPLVPKVIAGMSLEALRADYRERLFEQYIPFWDQGGYDSVHGGFMCELHDDGTVQNDEKYIWYQGRAIWVYAHLYNNFDQDQRFLEIASRTRDFMVQSMYAGDGLWIESVDRRGENKQSTGQGNGRDVYGALFAAAGLIELYKATGREEDLELSKTAIQTSMQRYDDPGYDGVRVVGVEAKGLRSQGHSFMVIWSLTQLLSFHEDPALADLQQRHIHHIVNDFWNSDYGIVNETLHHNYARISGQEPVMQTGHSIETLWMVMQAAIRTQDRQLFDTCKTRLRRLLEMSWDYVFEGCGTSQFLVFDQDGQSRGPQFDVKDMWTHTEIMVACMTVLEYTGEAWAQLWYERARQYTLRTMANTSHGVWRQAVDRHGRDLKRDGISRYRKGNFHQPRYMMMNMMSLDRMIANKGRLTPWETL